MPRWRHLENEPAGSSRRRNREALGFSLADAIIGAWKLDDRDAAMTIAFETSSARPAALLYRAGAKRKVSGRRGMTQVEEIEDRETRRGW